MKSKDENEPNNYWYVWKDYKYCNPCHIATYHKQKNSQAGYFPQPIF